MDIDLKKLTHIQGLKILAILILSEGYINHSRNSSPFIRLNTLSSSREQHELFDKLCIHLFNKKPRRYNYMNINSSKSSASKMTHSEVTPGEAIEELYALSPTFKTTAGSKISNREFMKSDQPTIRFLFNEPQSLRELALRIWFDFDGSIIPNYKLKRKRDKKSKKIYNYFQIQFECEVNIAETNPNLVKELLQLCESVGLKARVKTDNRKWSGIDGICISKLESIKKFTQMGPITNIKISSKSNRFQNIRKKDMCQAINSLISDKNVPLSKYFKEKKEAIKYRKHLTNLLIQKIEKYNKSPIV